MHATNGSIIAKGVSACMANAAVWQMPSDSPNLDTLEIESIPLNDMVTWWLPP
jgi:hypothetical protein